MSSITVEWAVEYIRREEWFFLLVVGGLFSYSGDTPLQLLEFSYCKRRSKD